MNLLKSLISKNIIIGIHGLANKPSMGLLEKWWIKSIREGLAYIGHPGTSFTFQLVYWADLLHEVPLDPHVKNTKSPSYMDDPYTPGDPSAYKNFTPSKIKKKLLDTAGREIDKLFFERNNLINFDKLAGLVIKNLYKDLDFYYNRDSVVSRFKGQRVRDAIRMRLAQTLDKYRKKRILLIAHSMGTIIAYDVLTRTTPDVRIDTLVTVGSPLGLPFIIKKIYDEQGKDCKVEKQAITPENILRKWYNFSDLDDPVAIIYQLAGDFKKNSRGVAPEDSIVFNNYEYGGKRDAHKLYGYLRTPEVAGVIRDFCGKPSGWRDALFRFFK
jgi:hypothetical protein